MEPSEFIKLFILCRVYFRLGYELKEVEPRWLPPVYCASEEPKHGN